MPKLELMVGDQHKSQTRQKKRQKEEKNLIMANLAQTKADHENLVIQIAKCIASFILFRKILSVKNYEGAVKGPILDVLCKLDRNNWLICSHSI